MSEQIHNPELGMDRRRSFMNRGLAVVIATSALLASCGFERGDEDLDSRLPSVAQPVEESFDGPVQSGELKPAVRTTSIINEVQNQAVRVTNCSGSLIKDPITGELVGAVGARHCMAFANKNQLFGSPIRIYSEPFKTSGPFTQVAFADVLAEEPTDTLYIGLNGNSPLEVKETIRRGLEAINFETLPIDTPVYAAGLPAYGGNTELQPFRLEYKGVVTISEDVQIGGVDMQRIIRVMVTSGKRNAQGHSCSGNSSGMAANIYQNGILVPVGPLVSFREFAPIINMPPGYTAEYGEEVRESFETHLGVSLDGAEQLCLFGVPGANLAEMLVEVPQADTGQKIVYVLGNSSLWNATVDSN